MEPITQRHRKKGCFHQDYRLGSLRRMNGETRKEREGGTESRKEGAKEGGREENNSHTFCERTVRQEDTDRFQGARGELSNPIRGAVPRLWPQAPITFSCHKKGMMTPRKPNQKAS